MVCIYCGGDTDVVNSRQQKRANQVWRRRKCRSCGAVFTTTEQARYEAAWRVTSPSGGLVPFNRDKLLLSLHKSLEHRSSSLGDAAALTDTVIAKLRGQSHNGIIEAAIIAQTAFAALERFDKPAAVSYRAFHPLER
ncbi:MAG TPA: hypothetical protein VF261_02360 [Candidatus Saccharimonadales bacterium]